MSAKAAFLADRAVLRVEGADRLSFLQGLLTNDVESLAEGEARFAGLLSPQGKILFDFFVIAVGESLFLDCPGIIAADLLKRLTFYRLRASVTIADVSEAYRVAAAWDEGALDLAKANAAIAYADPRLPALGVRALAGKPDAAALPNAFEDYEAMRIALAIPEGGKDYAYGDAFPHDACFDLLNGVSFKKGCFVGQEVVSRMEHRGTARTRVLAVSAGQPLPQGGADIMADGFAVGRLGSAAGSRGVALARLDRVRDALAKGQALTVGGVAIEAAAPGWASYSLDPAA